MGVSCAPEREAWATIHTTAAPRALGDEPGLNRDAALLRRARRAGPAKMYTHGRAASAAPTEEELRDWVGRLVPSLQRKACASAVRGPLTRRGTFFAPPRRHAVLGRTRRSGC